MTGIIAQLVVPLKEQAVERAAENTKAYIARLIAKLEAGGWNLSVVAPRPESGSDARYKEKRAMIDTYKRFVVTDYEKAEMFDFRERNRVNGPKMVKVDPRRVEKFIEDEKYEAGLAYDAFVAKLEKKIGDVETAKLTGNHVWDYSIIEATKKDGTVEKWKTTTIWNRSKYNKLFIQCPTRKIK